MKVSGQVAGGAVAGARVPRGQAVGELAARWGSENPRSAELHERALRSLPAGVTHDVRRADPFSVAVARAAGSKKWDLDGHEIICYVLGHGSLLLGHGNPEVVAAVQEQAARFLHPGAAHELECDWAESVVDLVPSAERVRFTSSGTEATLLALRLARAVTGRPKIVKLAGHFHGWSDQVAYGADPPFTGPDTAGLPPGLEADVAGDPRRPRVGSRGPRPARRRRAHLGALGSDVGNGPAAGWLPGGRARLDARVRHRPRLRRGGLGVPLVARWRAAGGRRDSRTSPRSARSSPAACRGEPCAGAPNSSTPSPFPPATLAGSRTRARTTPARQPRPPASSRCGWSPPARPRKPPTGSRPSCVAQLTEVLERRGVAGRVYGESSTFHLLLGHEGAPESLPLSEIKAGLDPRLSAELHCGMLLGGVHLFHGSGFVSTEHTERDLEQTVAAFSATVPVLQAEGLL